MKHKLILLYSWLVRTLTFFVPDIPITMRFRGWLYGLAMPQCGKNFQVSYDAYIKTLDHSYIGDNVFIGSHTLLLGGGDIFIGDEVLIAPHCVIVSGNHKYKDGSFKAAEGVYGTIKIEANCWITSNCTIGVGALLPKGSVLAANSFLNKSFSVQNSIYGGVPAKHIKELDK